MSAEGKSTAKEKTELSVSMETGTQPASDLPDDERNAETPSTWADQDESSERASDATPIPDAIRRLYKNGMRFKKAPSSVWGTEGQQNRLHKAFRPISRLIQFAPVRTSLKDSRKPSST